MPIGQFVGVFIGICTFIGVAIQSYHTPKSDLMPIVNARQAITAQIRSLTALLKRPYYTRILIFEGIQALGEVLDQVGGQAEVMEAFRNESFGETMWEFLAGESCESQSSIGMIFIGLNLLRDLSLSANDTVVNWKRAGVVFARCYEIQDIVIVFSQILIAATRTQSGLASLEGIGRPIIGTVVRDEFGPWTLSVWRFLAVWANARDLRASDRKDVCHFFEYALEHKSQWKTAHSAAMCLLAEGVNCSCMATPEFQKIHQNSGCEDVVRRFREGLKTENS
jgi:hypothetical protein